MQNNNHLIVLILMYCVKQARLHIHCVWKKRVQFPLHNCNKFRHSGGTV